MSYAMYSVYNFFKPRTVLVCFRLVQNVTQLILSFSSLPPSPSCPSKDLSQLMGNTGI